MKVSLLTNEFPPNVYGGAGVHVANLARCLRKKIKIDAFYFGKKNYTKKNLKVFGFASKFANAKNIQEGVRKVLNTLSIDISMVKDISRDSDIVHTHTWYTAIAGTFASCLYDIPHLMTVHSLEPLRDWKREALGFGYDLSTFLEMTAIRNAAGVIAVSAQTKEDVIKYYKVPAYRIKVIHNGVDAQTFKPCKDESVLKKYSIPNGRYVLFVGRISLQKGLRYLIDASIHFPKDVALVMVATDPDTKSAYVEVKRAIQRVKKLSRKIVLIEKKVSEKDLVNIYSGSSVFCCPSIYEPFGIINLEAMACEIPVVATNTGGIPDIITNGKSGFLVENKQRKKFDHVPVDSSKFSLDLADRINFLLEDEKLRNKMGKYGREQVLKRFSWEVIADKTRRYYDFLKLINQKRTIR